MLQDTAALYLEHYTPTAETKRAIGNAYHKLKFTGPQLCRMPSTFTS
jgi:hypothetical protein